MPLASQSPLERRRANSGGVAGPDNNRPSSDVKAIIDSLGLDDPGANASETLLPLSGGGTPLTRFIPSQQQQQSLQLPMTEAEFPCIICMEDLPQSEVRFLFNRLNWFNQCLPFQMRQHNANCDCLMCKSCLDRTIEHHDGDGETPKGHIKCPGCREMADPTAEFVPMDQVKKN